MLTPRDIENKEFQKKMVFNGYDADEVEDFLEEILRDYEILYKENIELKDKANSLNDGISHYKSMEDTLQNTLMVAQNAAEDLKNNAKKEAENIIGNANNKAQEILSEINNKLTAKQIEYDELVKQVEVYKAKTEALLISQLELLKEQSKD
ncbi:MAG: DivIVA domain-containing protein [Clostridiales bacterium]|nr:DivIVA domain-containing protein [Clostridiales bacterium]